jgi:hypothetical protein
MPHWQTNRQPQFIENAAKTRIRSACELVRPVDLRDLVDLVDFVPAGFSET